MTALRTTSLVAGLLFLVTHVTSVAAVALYAPLTGGGEISADVARSVRTGALLEIVLAIAVVGTAACLEPLLRRSRRTAARAYLGLRVLEAGVILMGVIAMLAAVAGPSSDVAMLLGLHAASFLVGPALVLSVSTTVLAVALLTSGIAPRWIGVLGTIGGPLVGASSVLSLYGVIPQVSPLAAALAMPVFAWEVSLAVWLIARGGRPRPSERDRGAIIEVGSATTAGGAPVTR